MSRSLDFTACTRKCATPCWRKLTKEEEDWLKKKPNRQSYCSFDDCEDFTEDKKDCEKRSENI